MKNKFIVWLVLLLVGLYSAAYVLGTSLLRWNTERKIAEQNLVAKSTEVSEYKTKLEEKFPKGTLHLEI